MGNKSMAEFQGERARLNRLLLDRAGRNIKRFFSLDHQAYQSGALPAKTKELLGLVASAVLRCDDCIRYHLLRCNEEGVSDAELEESLAVALLAGGSITIPHLRRAFASWEELRPKKKR